MSENRYSGEMGYRAELRFLFIAKDFLVVEIYYEFDSYLQKEIFIFTKKQIHTKTLKKYT